MKKRAIFPPRHPFHSRNREKYKYCHISRRREEKTSNFEETALIKWLVFVSRRQNPSKEVHSERQQRWNNIFVAENPAARCTAKTNPINLCTTVHFYHLLEIVIGF